MQPGLAVVNEGLPNPAPVSGLTFNPLDTLGTVYIGMFKNQNGGASVYKRNFSVGVNQISTEVPDGFKLSQNYPNPFNPATKIKFAVPKNSEVKLIIYNELGKEIETLVNKQLSAGVYEADWNAANYSSGVYFYTITANGFTDTRKMLLVK